jgi:cell wall-associated NlpC family hydrolase
MITNLIGKTFKDGGRGPDEFDCWGLIKWIYKHEFAIELPDYTISAFDPQGINGAIQRDRHVWTTVDTPEFGDLCLFSLDYLNQDFITHVGMYMAGGKYIHALSGHDVSMGKLDNTFWKLRFKGLVRWQD